MPDFNFENLKISIYNEIIFQSYLAKESIDQSKFSLGEYSRLSTELQGSACNTLFIEDLFLQTNMAMYKFFRNIHAFIVAHGNISKLLYWRGNSKNKDFEFLGNQAEKKQIKDFLLGLRTKTGTFQSDNRPLRDHLEHFDERLISRASHANTSPLKFSHSSQREEYAHNLSEENYLRTIIYDHAIYSVTGNDYCLKEMGNEIKKLCLYIIEDQPFYLGKYKNIFDSF